MSSSASSAVPAPAGPASAGVAIRLDGLVRRYGERVALAGVSLELGEGETLAIFGPNGAGKTTLLRVLAGLLRPHEGSVQVLGAELPREGWRLRGRVGYLGHEPLVYRDLTPRENLLFHARLHGVPEARVGELLAAVGLERRAAEPARALSRGMLQRLAAARAVLHDPPLLLLDEPRANLDPAAAELLEPLIGRQSGRTRLIATHDAAWGLEQADTALGLRGGHQAFLAQAAGVDQGEIAELYR